MRIDGSAEHLATAAGSMTASFEPGSNSTVERDLQPQKHWRQSFSTDEGMQIDESAEQSENAEQSIRDSREPGSNVTIERDSHRRKQLGPSDPTEDGIQIDDSIEQSKKARSPIIETSHPLSKITLETVRQKAKEPPCKPFTLFPIVTVATVPKNMMIQPYRRSITKSPHTLKTKFPSSIEISRRFGALSAK
jgi:hypothetical protein